jgi:PST family polysaccharide transporter
LLASGFVLRAGAGAVGVAAVLVAARIGWGLAGEEPRLLAVLAVVLLQPALFLPEVWLQAQLRAQWVAAGQIGALAVASGVRLWLIATDAPLVAFAWVIVGEMALGAIAFFASARRAGLRMPVRAARGATMRGLVAEAWPLMFASLAVLVYMKIDEVMLRQLAGPAAVGIYSAAVKLSELWYFLPMAVASSVLPALLRAQRQGGGEYARRHQQYYDLSAAVAYGLSVPVAFAAPWIVRVAYGAEFAAAGPILAVHIWSSIFVFLGVARGQWLVNEGRQRFTLAATCGGAAINVGLNLIFIPRWGGLGAAWATVVAYGFAAWLSSYLHPAVRGTAAMQTRALLIPFRAWVYLRRA